MAVSPSKATRPKCWPASPVCRPSKRHSEGTAMSLNEEVEMLRRIQLFAKVEPAKLKLLAFTSERAMFQAEEVLFHQGDAADSAYIIVAGEVAIDVESPGGGSTRVAKLGKDQIVGEIGILADVPRTATVTATAPTTTLKISKE